MTVISSPIVFFGTENFSLIALQALIDAGFPVAAVVTKPDTVQGRGHKMTSPPVKLLAEKYSIPVWQPVQLTEIANLVTELDAPVGVLVSYGKIIPQSIIDLFTPGIINLHPSLLPKYRGPSPIEAAILNGDDNTGVSIMLLSAKMDAGPVYSQDVVTLTKQETAEMLYDQLGHLGSHKLVTMLPDILSGSVFPTPQDDTQASYCQLIKKSDGYIGWTIPAAEIERRVRAYHEWPQTRVVLGNVDVILGNVSVTEQPSSVNPGTITSTSNTLIVSTVDGSLCINTLKPLGKKEMPVTAFLAGYRDKING